ncbi:unnamed protein product [Sphagnum balticum]
MISMVQDSGIAGLAGMKFILSRIKRVNSRCLRCSDSKIKHSLEGKRCSPRVLEISRFKYFRNSVLQFWR